MDVTELLTTGNGSMSFDVWPHSDFLHLHARLPKAPAGTAYFRRFTQQAFVMIPAKANTKSRDLGVTRWQTALRSEGDVAAMLMLPTVASMECRARSVEIIRTRGRVASAWGLCAAWRNRDVLSPSQLGGRQDALKPLWKLVSITDCECETVLEQLRNEYNVSFLYPYLKIAPEKGRKPKALGGKPNQPGHRAGQPKRNREM
ncbi:hypothetical protein THAOC_23549 [Thalassiosira oceanica]|uniref:Uncharacterized protein n=1 Tax=Thalassiosira oceanica TaxID=159749 RepID=K0RVT6_THAOC|nr:hypothetical protein THAOC_23549 [Thalassiosira oceanica]|eukprot:EJK56544.1 hypothetical protein THAOC_23549 [Thalassiosira oceanica]